MKRIDRIYLVVLLLLLLPAGVQAVYVKLSCAETLPIGAPLTVFGTGNLPPGFSTDVIFSWMHGTKQEIERQRITVQEEGDFTVSFKTAGLSPGLYTVEMIDPTGDTFGGSSVTMRMVELTDRSSSITITSPLTQEFNGTLIVAGKIEGNQGTGVKIEVTGESGSVFPGRYIATDRNGAFSQAVPISEPGVYNVRFTDREGYLGDRTFTVTHVETPVPTTPTPISPSLSIAAPASRDEPAYLVIRGCGKNLRVETSAGMDWIVEYITGNGESGIINEQGLLTGEVLEIPGSGGTLYLKIYPASWTESGEVSLEVRDAGSVEISPMAAAEFGDAVPGTTPTSPLSFTVAVAAPLIGAAVAMMMRRH
ncbi:MAG: hypothetical protein ACXQTG_02925 [Methanoculleaceae archaeon]